MSWGDLNKRQQEYLQAIYEADQEQEAYQRGAWSRGDRVRPAREWRWIEYGCFDGVQTSLYSKLYLRKLINEGTRSTFDALERRGFITCKYTQIRKNGQFAFEHFPILQITCTGYLDHPFEKSHPKNERQETKTVFFLNGCAK